MTHTDTSPVRWHANTNPALRDSLDTIDAHQRRVTGLCCTLAAFMGHVLIGSDLLHAALNHDEAEMGLSWTLTPKEQQMLNLCDKLDAYTWARKHGARGPEWDDERGLLMVMADKFNAREWVLAEMSNRVPVQEASK